MKTIGIMQPYLFPYLGYFQLINAVDEYVVYDDVQYIKGGWINRNNLLVNGEKKLFTIALAGASIHKKINEIYIADNFEVIKKTIEFSYKKAPYYSDVFTLLEDIFRQPDHNLARFTEYSLRVICDHLNIKTDFIYSSSIDNNKNLKGEEKVIDICLSRSANKYVNAIGGKNLYHAKSFNDSDIELSFLKPCLPEYKQLQNQYMPGLSIIDVMMFNSPSMINKMLGNYELIK